MAKCTKPLEAPSILAKQGKVTSVIYNFMMNQYKPNKTLTTKISVPILVILTLAFHINIHANS